MNESARGAPRHTLLCVDTTDSLLYWIDRSQRAKLLPR